MGNFISGLSQTAEQALKGYKLDGTHHWYSGILHSNRRFNVLIIMQHQVTTAHVGRLHKRDLGMQRAPARNLSLQPFVHEQKCRLEHMSSWTAVTLTSPQAHLSGVRSRGRDCSTCRQSSASDGWLFRYRVGDRSCSCFGRR